MITFKQFMEADDLDDMMHDAENRQFFKGVWELLRDHHVRTYFFTDPVVHPTTLDFELGVHVHTSSSQKPYVEYFNFNCKADISKNHLRVTWEPKNPESSGLKPLDTDEVYLASYHEEDLDHFVGNAKKTAKFITNCVDWYLLGVMHPDE